MRSRSLFGPASPDGWGRSGASALAALFAAFGLHCSSQPIGIDPFGEHATERTLIVTGIGQPNAEGCGAPQAPVSGEAVSRYKVSHEADKVQVTDLAGGCVLEARVEGDVVIADNQACALGDSAPLRQLGVANRFYSVFRLDAGRKTVVSRAITDATVTTGETRSCFVAEERIVGAQAPELGSHLRLRYVGSLTTTVEQPESEVECGRDAVTSESSGYLSIDRVQPSARLEGFGCKIGLAEPEGAKFSASSQACVPEGVVSFEGVGIERLDIESFTVDLSEKTALWRARAWRQLPNGRVSYCFNLKASIEQR